MDKSDKSSSGIIYAKKMDCTSYDQDHCNVEKMGCDGCGHNLDNENTDERK